MTHILPERTLLPSESRSSPAVGVSSPSGFDRVRMPKTGIEFPQRMSFDKWLVVGRQLSNVVASSAWCLGDWVVYGEASYNGRYRDAIEQTSLDYQTLRNYAWVARRFTFSRRRECLSFGHHAEVAALPEPEQEFWLRKAESFKWSRSQLRREVRTSLSQRSEEPAGTGTSDAGPERRQTPTGGEPAPSVPAIQINVTPTQRELCRLAADRAGVSIEEWAVSVLDHAARSQVDLVGVPMETGPGTAGDGGR